MRVLHPRLDTCEDPVALLVRIRSALGRWLQRQWQAACEQAERPDRQVPYY